MLCHQSLKSYTHSIKVPEGKCICFWFYNRRGNCVWCIDGSLTVAGGTQLKTTGGGQIEEVVVKREPTTASSMMTAASSSQQTAYEEGADTLFHSLSM